MDASLISAISGGAGVILTTVVGLIVSKNTNRKDIAIADRQRLSQDQQYLLDFLMKQNKDLSDRVERLEGEVTKWKEEALQLKIENIKHEQALSTLQEEKE